MPVPAPAGGILSFASPKESIQRKGNPDAPYTLRSTGLNGVFRRGLPAPAETRCIPASPLRADPLKPSGARRGKRDKTRREIRNRLIFVKIVGRISDSVMRRMLEGQHAAQYGYAY